MSNGTLSQLGAKRKLGFLTTVEKKVHDLRREAERLQRASAGSGPSDGRHSLDEIIGIVRGLIGAGPVYGIGSMTAWAKEAQKRLETMRRGDAPSANDLEWLASQIQDLERLRDEELEGAEHALEGRAEPPKRQASSVPPPMPETAVDHDREAHGELDDEGGAEAHAPSEEGAEPEERPAEVIPITVLAVVDQKNIRKKVATSLASAGFEVTEVDSAVAAAGVSREETPDLIIVDDDDPPPGGAALADELSGDPLTDFIPIVHVGTGLSETEGSVAKPIDTDVLVNEARRATGYFFEADRGLRDLTLEQLTEFVASEVRAGVLDAATGSHVGESFPVVEKGPLIASIWSLIARLRRLAAEGSQGKIRFVPTARGPVGMMALDEAEGVLDPTSHAVVDETDISDLAGLSALVVDDDVEIRAVFDKVLSQVGMRVSTASNGAVALGAIVDSPPDVVITDILMPEMDGWELTARLKRNYAFKHIPVIMISWKEDFLQRIKELDLKADGFMLKELDRQQILNRVAGVLAPRFQLGRRLEDGGEVAGNVELVGVLPLLKAAADLRPDSRITLRESWNYFEADLKGGELVAVNRTGTDGSFASGMVALERLLGVKRGRFTIGAPGEKAPRRQFPDGASKAIRQATKRLNDLNEKVVGGGLVNVVRVQLDEEVVAVYSEVIPTKLKRSVERLARGESPRELVLDASTSSEALETLLLDLIRMGAVKLIVEAPGVKKSTTVEPELTGLAGFAVDEIPELELEPDTDDERSGTMPLAIDDLAEVGPPPPPLQTRSLPPPIPSLSRPAPPPREEHKKAIVWQLLSVGFFVAFAAMAYLFFTRAPAPAETPAQVVAAAPPAIETPPLPQPELAPPVEPEPAAETAVEAKPEPATEPATEPVSPKAAGVVAAERKPEAEREKRTRKDEPGTARLTEERRERRAERRKEKKEEPAPAVAEPEKKPEAPPAPKPGTTGTLVITAPANTKEPIKVSVDGRFRGKAPMKLKLTAGLHEIVFSSGGKRSMRMVSMKIKQSKTIEAKVPR